jgi:hypothetical protein
VTAQLQAHHAVGFVDAAGEHQDGDLRRFAQAARDAHAIFARQAQVEDHHVEGVARHRLGELAAGGHGRDAQLVLGEIVRDELADRRVIVERQNVRLQVRYDFHRQTPSSRCRCESDGYRSPGAAVWRRPARLHLQSGRRPAKPA